MAGGKVERRSLGRWPRPRAVKLWPAATVLYLGEGIETVLAAATRLPYRDRALMHPAWAAVSTGGIGKFPVLPSVQELRPLSTTTPRAKPARCPAANARKPPGAR